MLLHVEFARVEEATNGTPSWNQGHRLTEDECDNLQEDVVHQDGLGLEVEDLSNNCSEASKTNTEEEGSESIRALRWIIRHIQCLGDELQI